MNVLTGRHSGYVIGATTWDSTPPTVQSYSYQTRIINVDNQGYPRPTWIYNNGQLSPVLQTAFLNDWNNLLTYINRPTLLETAVVTGLTVTNPSGRVYAVASGTYTIAGREYSSEGGTVELDAPDASFPRYDAITIDQFGIVSVVKGEASAWAHAEVVDPSRYLVLQVVFVAPTAGWVTGSYIANQTITASNIQNLTITAAQIANATITGAQIANASITGTQIANLTITAANIANSTITSTQIANSTITGANIANQTISAANLVNQTITAAQIANLTITAAEIANLTINGSKIVDKAITGGKIDDKTITATNIADATITALQIANATITATQISGTAGITGSQIANATITASNIQNNTITATQIANLTITANQIANLTITGGKLSVGTITADKLVVGNFDNLVDDPGFERNIGWSSIYTGLAFTNVEDAANAHSGARCLTHSGAGSPEASNNAKLDTQPGDKFYVEVWAKATVAADGVIYLGFIGFDKDGAVVGVNTAIAANTLTSTWTKLSTTLTVPATVIYLRPGFFIWMKTTGTVYFDDFYCRRMVGTAIIEDASITTAKIGNLQVTNAHIASVDASKITTGTLVVKSQITNGDYKVTVDAGLNRFIVENTNTTSQTWINPDNVVTGRPGTALVSIGNFSGKPMILLSKSSNNRAVIEVNSNGGALSLYDSSNNEKVILSANYGVQADTFRFLSTHTPSSYLDTGTAGEMRYDSNYLYVCIATNTWRRIALYWV
jgi:uncharacterized protein YjbI with pentapeptide repeats